MKRRYFSWILFQFILVVFLSADEIPYFSKLSIEDFENAKEIGSANELQGIGPHPIEIHRGAILGSGLTLRAHFYKAENPKALLLGVHGLQSNARWFHRTGTQLAKNGISVLVYDRRGSGLSDGNRPFLHRLLGIGLNFDKNPRDTKVSPGLRGHIGFLGIRPLVLNAPHQFLSDIDAAFKKLIRLHRDLRGPYGNELDVHILANCFGSRIAIPYARKNERVKTLIITAPSTDMHPRADITSLFKKADIATPSIRLLGRYDYVSTPLKDSYFVSPSSPAYAGIANNKVSLSLRYGTGDFFYATRSLHKRMLRSLPKMETPIFIALANRDQMVLNKQVRDRFFNQYTGPGRIITFDAEHMIEFGPAGQSFGEAVTRWIDADLQWNRPELMNTKGLNYILKDEAFGERE